MNRTSKTALGAALLLGVALAGVLFLRPAAAQPQAPVGAPEQFRTLDLPVGKFVYRFLFDSATGEHWLWTNGEWDRPEPPKGGYPWKDLKPLPGRFQLLAQITGEIDAEMYLLDTTTGRMWARPARNRPHLFEPEDWRAITPPGRPKR
ncbi:MAG: hypothetical protein L0Z62_42825 [Gemmataceae bacterium]|nr:hypothetical protein [Gemmataceae bacterium]